jgi:predicted DNA-binding transcriptional regulator AlpA
MEDSIKELADQIGVTVVRGVLQRLHRGDLPVAPEYLTAPQAAALTGFTAKALERYRQQPDKGPKFFRVGTSIRYRADDLRAWIEAGGPGQ